MSILIKKMEMPKGCWACPFAVGKHYECLFTRKSYNWGLTTRPSDCPLIEVPTPHGRLVDADAFKETIDYYIREANWSDAHNEALGWAKEFIDNEQAVIEAEVEDVTSRIRQMAGQAGKILVDAALNAIKESEGSET